MCWSIISIRVFPKNQISVFYMILLDWVYIFKNIPQFLYAELYKDSKV